MIKTYINALVYDKKNLGIDPIIRDSIRTFYYRNLYIDSVEGNPLHSIIEDSVDTCINYASESKFDFLILTWEGNIFDIHQYHNECINYIKKLGDEWLVAGQIIDQHKNRLLFKDSKADDYKNSFYLFPITALINLKKWRSLGKPLWGDSNQKQTVLKVIPSNECVHDDYTPIKIEPGTSTTTILTKPGWNIINTSLINNLPVYNLNNEIRNCQNYLYPENNVEKYNKFWQSLFMMPKLTPQYKKVLESILPSKNPKRINDKTWQCFIRNTEYYYPYEAKFNHNIDYSDIETYIFPASGFKDFVVCMGKFSRRQYTRIIHYDIIPQCLEIKSKIINQWNGDRETFVNTLTEISKEYREDPTHVFHMNSMNSIIEAYEHILKYFIDEDDLKKCWQEFKTFLHYYVEADILEDPDSVSNVITTSKIYLCLSDVAGWRNNIIGYGYKNLRNNILVCLEKLRSNNIQGYVDYKDPKTDQQLWQTIEHSIKYLNDTN